MRHGATDAEVRRVVAVIEEMGYKAQPMPGVQRTAVGLVGNDGRVDASRLEGDRKSTRLNSSHSQISYAVFCLKKKKRNCASRQHRSRLRTVALRVLRRGSEPTLGVATGLLRVLVFTRSSKSCVTCRSC